MRSRHGIDPLCTRDALDVQARAFLGQALAKSPEASPVYADVRGMPPMLIQIGESEVMLSGAVQMVTHLGENRVRATLEIWPEMFHVWHLFAAVLPEAEDAIQSAATFLKQNLR
jgi:acetyl esterase/lipase